MYKVYIIKFNETIVYIGHTDNLKRRSYQHNRLFKNGYKKLLYDYLRLNNYKDKLELEEIKEFKSKVEAKRYECFLILTDYFTTKQLQQKVPNISDR